MPHFVWSATAATRRVLAIRVLVASATRARDILGWQPRRPDLDDIVADAWAFTEKTRMP